MARVTLYLDEETRAEKRRPVLPGSRRAGGWPSSSVRRRHGSGRTPCGSWRERGGTSPKRRICVAPRGVTSSASDSEPCTRSTRRAALEQQAVLVTRNTREFRRVKGLRVDLVLRSRTPPTRRGAAPRGRRRSRAGRRHRLSPRRRRRRAAPSRRDAAGCAGRPRGHGRRAGCGGFGGAGPQFPPGEREDRARRSGPSRVLFSCLSARLPVPRDHGPHRRHQLVGHLDERL